MKLSPEDLVRLLRAIRLTNQIENNFLKARGVLFENPPKRGGRAFRKRRSIREN
jgi:hypothetical protein